MRRVTELSETRSDFAASICRVMYTGAVVRLRSFGLVLSLLVAATPVMGVVCAMDCDRPPATSLPCHGPTVPREGILLHAAPHACDHDHTGGSPALLTNASARGSEGISVVSAAPTLALAFLPEAHGASADAVHGPPGLGARRASFHVTVLRI
jgi:hypothetical protein